MDMIHILKGDLLESDCNFILHQANSEKIMGKGLAEMIAKKYPIAEKVDKEFPYQMEERLGKYSIAKINEELYVVNLYGQLLRGKPKNKVELEQRYQHFKNSINSFLNDLNKKQRIEKKRYKVGLPYKIGSDLAGAKWERILDILLEVSEETKQDLYVYKLK